MGTKTPVGTSFLRPDAGLFVVRGDFLSGVGDRLPMVEIEGTNSCELGVEIYPSSTKKVTNYLLIYRPGTYCRYYTMTALSYNVYRSIVDL